MAELSDTLASDDVALLKTPTEHHEALVETIVSNLAPIQERLIFGSLIYPTRRTPQNSNLTQDLHHFLRQVFQKAPRRNWEEPQLKRLFVIEQSEQCGIHAHFLLECPAGMNRETFMTLCRERWVCIALRDYRAAEAWSRLSSGTRIHPDETRTMLIKNRQIMRPSFPQGEPRSPIALMRDSRRLAVIRPVDHLRGGTGYCLKSDGNDDLNLESALALTPTAADVLVKGHSLATCLW